MSKLSDFLKTKKIDPRRVLVASAAIENLKVEDRKLRLKKKQIKAGGKDVSDEDKALATKKPRSGKPVSAPTLAAALKGESILGPAKTRTLRAVNYLLQQKKQPEVTLKDLF